MHETDDAANTQNHQNFSTTKMAENYKLKIIFCPFPTHGYWASQLHSLDAYSADTLVKGGWFYREEEDDKLGQKRSNTERAELEIKEPET